MARRVRKGKGATWSTLFMKQVLPRLERPRKPYGNLCPLSMALVSLSVPDEAAEPSHSTPILSFPQFCYISPQPWA